MPQASKYAENAELQETKIDAAGIKIRRRRGNSVPRRNAGTVATGVRNQ
jgi:hypothetical protein